MIGVGAGALLGIVGVVEDPLHGPNVQERPGKVGIRLREAPGGGVSQLSVDGELGTADTHDGSSANRRTGHGRQKKEKCYVAH